MNAIKMTRTENQSYSTFSSSSYSSITDSSGTTHTESITSNPSGTTIQKTTQRPGELPTTETTRLPANERQQVEGGDRLEAGKRIEDVTDADREYEERIEDEYAKREGGAWWKWRHFDQGLEGGQIWKHKH